MTAVELLGCHVLWRAVDASRVGQCEVLCGGIGVGAKCFRETEIENADLVVVAFFVGEHDVGGFEIAVDDLQAVGFHESAEDLFHDGFCAREREGAFVDAFVEARAADEFHRHP